MTKKQINIILRDNLEVWENIEREKITINKHIFKPSLNSKYLYIKT